MRDMSTESPPASPQTSPSHIEVEEITTIFRTPMLRPTSEFRKVIHFGGGKGETFTMNEMIGYVKKYIEDRKLYDEQDPRIVYCKGNDLEAAFHVESFTISDVLNLFRKHCFEEADSHLRINRQVVTRPLYSASSSREEVQESSKSPSPSRSSSLLSSRSVPRCKSMSDTKSTSNTKLRPTPAFLKVIHLGGGTGETFTMNEIMDFVKKYILDHKLYDEQHPHIVHCNGNDLGAAFHVDTITVSPELINLFKSHCHSEMENQRGTNQPAETAFELENQPTSSSQEVIKGYSLPQSSSFVTLSCSSSTASVSSSKPTNKPSLKNTCYSSNKSPSVRAAHPPSTTFSRRDLDSLQLESSSCIPSTSVSVTTAMDEIDGDPSPWSYEVTVDVGEPKPNGEGSHNSLVVEYSSDNFSVEYELVSSSEPEPLPASGDTEESERSPSNSEAAAALYVVCEESDIEYLADYSDSNTESDAELDEEDKWQCNQCRFKNSALYRNCGKCWSLRPDWLPTDSSGINNIKVKEKTLDKIFDTLPPQKLSSFACSITDTSPSEPEKMADVDRGKSIQAEPMSDCPSPTPGLVPSFSQDSAIGSMACSQELAAECDVNSDKLEAESEKCNAKSCGIEIKKRIRSKKRRYSSSSQEELESKKKKSVKVCKTPPVNPETEEADPNHSLTDPCVICLTRPRTACIIHGKTGHQVCCYRCARRLKKQRKSCPICRRPIQKVVRNFF